MDQVLLDQAIQNIDKKAKNLDLPVGSRGRGRKDGAGGEEVLKVQPVKDGCKELMVLYKKSVIAKEAYNAAAKAIAEKSNANTATIKRLIESSAKGKFEDVKRAVEQTADLFEAVGEVSASDVH